MYLRGLSDAKRRAWAATLTASVVTAGLLSGPAAQARPAPEPPLTTMSIKSPPGGSGPQVLIFHGSAAAEVGPGILRLALRQPLDLGRAQSLFQPADGGFVQVRSGFLGLLHG